MTINDILILRREDLLQEHVMTPYHKINNTHFKPNIVNMILKFNIVLFSDDDGFLYVFKNKFGKESTELFEYTLSQDEQKTERYMGAERFIMNLTKPLFVFNLRGKCRRFIKETKEKYKF